VRVLENRVVRRVFGPKRGGRNNGIEKTAKCGAAWFYTSQQL
jgi:hypothetical protein